MRRARAAKKTIKGQIRLGVFYGFSNSLLAQFLASLHRDHPALEVDILFGTPSELDRLLNYKRLDFSINLFKSSEEHGLIDTALIADELWLVSSQKPPRRALDFNELRKAPFVDYYRKSSSISSWVAHHFGKRVREIPIVMYASHSELVVQLILHGVGIGVVASSIAKAYVEAGELFVIRGHSRQLVSQIWLKVRQGTKLDEIKIIFQKHILEYFGG